MRLFTWYDVETELYQKREIWPASWNRVDVYHDEIVINIDTKINVEEKNQKVLKTIFGRFYNNESVLIEFDKTRMQVIYEDGDETDKKVPIKAPLFKDYSTNNESNISETELPGVPILSFHSYKGGVGRTLSLIALAKAISEQYGCEKRLLLIDADIEAPGLTWMLERGQDNTPVSYLDILSLMHFHNMDEILADEVARLIETSNLVIETEKLEVEHYFLPTYRTENQVMHIFSSPEKIIDGQQNKYAITEFLSVMGKKLHVDLILADLRAGITEFSAPFLFDSRVQKFFVSSTSMQSVKGTQLVMEEIHHKERLGLVNAKVLLTMIPSEMEEDTIFRIENELAEKIEQELDFETSMSLRENYLIRVPFEAPLISLGNFQEICAMLKGKNISGIMAQIVTGIFEKTEQKEEANQFSDSEIREFLIRINEIAKKEITAEGNASSNMLSTTSIREIVKDYKETIPQIVILGAKGSGKTYIYKQMVINKTWEGFIRGIDQSIKENLTKTLFLPLISSVNIQYIHDPIRDCIINVNRKLEDIDIDCNAVNLNYNKIMNYSERGMQRTEWANAWRKLLIDMLGGKFSDLSEIDSYLEKRKMKIVFLVDGLEDLFMDAQMQKQEDWKNAIRALCQTLVNDLRNLEFGNVGIIVFARRDMIEEAIAINFEQFQNQYSRYELRWTPTEALRLVLWIAVQAEPDLGKDIDILKASREALEERLERLWGIKLGKRDSREAYTARWIIAALSDFTGQLQARDIVRFLKFASDNLPNGKVTYPDRYLMPLEIRNAIPECSYGKFQEIKAEMKVIYQILKKLEDMDEGDKQLPLTLDKIQLTGEEIARLISQGYLITSDKKYYLPEIIRFALGFKYEKGARPKVLSLLTK